MPLGSHVEIGARFMPNRLRAFRGRVPAESLFCACQRHGGRSYAQKEQRPPCRKIVLKLPDLDHAKSAVLNSLSSPHSRRNYKFAMEQFITLVLFRATPCAEPGRCPAISPLSGNSGLGSSSAVRNPANSPKSADWSGLLFHTRCRTQGLPNCVGIG